MTSATLPSSAHAHSLQRLLERRRGRRARTTARPASMRLVRPASTLPGPHSTTCVTPRSRHRCGWSRPSAPGSPPGARARPGSRRARVSIATSTLWTTGIAGAANVDVLQIAAASRSAAGCSSERVERRAHRQQHARASRPSPCRPRSRARPPPSRPAITTWPGALKLTASTPRLRGLGARRAHRVVVERRGSPPSRPCPRAPPPASPARESAPAAGRRANASAPAATSAVYSPRLWPATTAGVGAARRAPRAPDRDAGGQHHRLRVDRQVERLRGPFVDAASTKSLAERVATLRRTSRARLGHAGEAASSCRPTASPAREIRTRVFIASPAQQHEPQVKPPPTPCSSTWWPARMRRRAPHSSSASGTEAADVLRVLVDRHDELLRAAGRASCAVASMMRMLAWCGISQSMSASAHAGRGERLARRLRRAPAPRT